MMGKEAANMTKSDETSPEGRLADGFRLHLNGVDYGVLACPHCGASGKSLEVTLTANPSEARVLCRACECRWTKAGTAAEAVTIIGTGLDGKRQTEELSVLPGQTATSTKRFATVGEPSEESCGDLVMALRGGHTKSLVEHICETVPDVLCSGSGDWELQEDLLPDWPEPPPLRRAFIWGRAYERLTKHMRPSETALVELTREQWQLLVQILEEQDEPEFRTQLLELVRDDSEVPDGWELELVDSPIPIPVAPTSKPPGVYLDVKLCSPRGEEGSS
jgi:hypothetical protein